MIDDLSAVEAAQRIAAGELLSEDLVGACADRIAAREDAVQAWIWYDRDRALAAAREADRIQAQGFGVGPLHGVPVAIKDIIDTADMPTENGYAGHKGRRPGQDAACVRALRDAGAVIMGKTVTTELAVRTPGKTRNPVNPGHTPGGSSSGSAAAVKDRMVPLALGTQTGGSVIRPASFCGVHGFKPSFGLISRTGVCMMADWLDTVGVFANSVEDMALIADVLTASDPADPACGPRSRPPLRQITLQDLSDPPRLAFVRTPKWVEADAAAQSALEAYARSLGGICREVDLPEEMEAAWTWHRILQTYGIAQHYGPLLDRDGDLMSPALREQVAEGRGLTEAAYRDAIVRRERASAALEAIFADVDALLTLPAPGPAPRGLDFTGDPVMNAFWTYAGVPCVTLPLLTVEHLPLGVQLVGRRGGDGPLLRVARWLDCQGAAGGD